jgi:glycosyltransferase involved in cell wall biosynthesis
MATSGKIKLLVWSHSANREGGGETDLRKFLERLQKTGDYELFGILPEGTARESLAGYFLKAARCRPAQFPLAWGAMRAYVAYVIFSMKQLLQTRAFLPSVQPDAVVFFSSCLVTPWLYTSLTKQCKHVLFVRELITPRWIRKLLFRLIFRRADLIITVSQFLKEEIQQLIPHTNIQTIYSLPSLPTIQHSPREKISGPRFHLAIIGAISPVKGHDLLIKALQSAQLRDTPITLHVIGERPVYGAHAPFLKYFDRLVRALPANVALEFHGTLPYADLINFLRTIEVLIIPSRSEGLSLTLMEAILLKVPVIAARIGEMQRILIEGEHGLLFTAEDVDDLAAKIVMLIKDKQLLERIRAHSGKLPSFLGDAETNWQKLEAALQKVCVGEITERQ